MITRNKVLLIFLIIFFAFQAFPFPINYFPYLADFGTWLEKGLHGLIILISNNILGLELTEPAMSGSGDKFFDYIFLLVTSIISIVTTIILSTILRHREFNYKKINYWFWVYLRYYLAATLIIYGLFKFFPQQMVQPSFGRLIKPYGEFSPMGVAWSFIGLSPGYQIFSGVLEIISGLLLLNKRSALLGGLLSIVVLSNVVALNFFYDIPVKIFSLELLIISFIIILPQISKLFKLIFGSEAVQPYRIYDPFDYFKNKKWKEAFKYLILVGFILWRGYNSYANLYSNYGPFREKPPLYGLYEIETFKINDREIPPLITDTIRWQYLSSEYADRLNFYNMKREPQFFQADIDTVKNRIELNTFGDKENVYTFKFKTNDSVLYLEGIYKQDSICIRAKRYNKEDFPLMNRKFNWIQEYPHNK